MTRTNDGLADAHARVPARTRGRPKLSGDVVSLGAFSRSRPACSRYVLAAGERRGPEFVLPRPLGGRKTITLVHPMRLFSATMALLSACGHEPPPARPPARLVAGASDTVVVNSEYPTTLPVRALDAEGRTVAGTSIRFVSAGSHSLPITAAGAVTCPRSGDFVVRATLDRLMLPLAVQCRLVEYVRTPGPIQFVLGDSMLSLPIAVRFVSYDAKARPISPAVAHVSVGDTSIVSLHGRVISPRRRGITWANARVGVREGPTGVHVYQRVDTLAALDTLLRVRDIQAALRGAPPFAQRRGAPAESAAG